MARQTVKKSKRKNGFKSNLPRDKDGNIIPSKGRPKGVPNKITGEAKHAIALVHEGLGGVPKMIEHFNSNKTLRTIFWTQLYTKLIPVIVQGKVDASFTDNTAAAAIEHTLVSLIAERLKGSEASPLVIDAEPNRDAVPQLVISSKTGSKAA